MQSGPIRIGINLWQPNIGSGTPPAPNNAIVTRASEYIVTRADEYILSTHVPLFIFTGSSNSGGEGDNADLTVTEAAVRPNTYILNNYTLTMQQLQIGVNNLLDHYILTDNAWHGWENQLANLQANNTLRYSRIYICKTGQGASFITDWNTGGTFFTKQTNRIAAAFSEIKSHGFTPIPVLFMSFGYTDWAGPLSVPTWNDWGIAVQDWIARIRAITSPNMRVVMTKFEAPAFVATEVNDQIDIITGADSNVKFASSAGASVWVGDEYHWDYGGLKTVTDNLVAQSGVTG